MTDTDTIERTEHDTKLDKPGFYNVVLHNDDVTTVEFVMSILSFVFHKSMEDAFKITMEVHDNGRGVAGTYTKEIAEEKSNEATTLARASNFPLQISFEKS